MKTKITLKMGGAEAVGMSRVGYMPDGTKYRDLVCAFGEPQRQGLSKDGKTRVEWHGKINGLEFTIYDYKSGVEPEKNTDWHIGGKIALVADLLTAYMR